MAIDDINRKATKLLLIKIGENRIIYQSSKILEKQVKMESVNEIKINHKRMKN